MTRNRQAEWIGGAGLAALGAATVAYALTHYQLGTLRQIGPGFLPVALGLGLILLGGLIAFLARPAGAARQIRPGNVAAITLSVVAFALLIERLGYGAAVIAAVLIATLPWTSGGWLVRGGLALGTAVFVGLVFQLGLGMAIHPFPR
ncbi:MAG: tripartite tricarboxylate transporter TctB family protein [Rhodobacter sp.]|nr:tripartite tricarboxylate transporter TctB family protein [Paracoccaceae bacterium]MCC0081547.1 tripartite tricarboxylate transporter TctB family protein [Rhodobacter sp.]